MSQKKKDWIIALAYVGFIYATLSVVRIPISYLRSHGLLTITLYTIYVLIFALLLAELIRRTKFEAWRVTLVVCIFLLYYIVGKHVSSPEEQIHFLEYGLVGVLFHRALQHHVSSFWKGCGVALILSSLAGWLDEILQGFLPSRHYDVRDILLNIISSFLGLLILVVFSRPAKQNKNSEFD